MDAEGDEADEILPMWQLLKRMRSDETAVFSPIGFFPDRSPSTDVSSLDTANLSST